MFQHLSKYSRILVTGPQRSGTRLVAQAIAHDTGHTYVDEKDIFVENVDMARTKLIQPNTVLQCPGLSYCIDDLADAFTLVVMVKRPVADIVASQERIKWPKEAHEFEKNGVTGEVREPIAEFKYRKWEEQKRTITNTLEVNYKDMEKHPVWNAKHERGKFAWDQTKPVKMVGVMAISNFPFYARCLKALCGLVDEVHIRFDGLTGDPEIFRELEGVCDGKLAGVQIAQQPWHPPEWREDMIRMLDSVKPDIVLCPDQDEEFGPGFADELQEFWRSDKDAMMIAYEPLVTRDGSAVNGGHPYPPKPHMKAFKWNPGLSYFPWHKQARVARYLDPATHWQAKTKLLHYACYTPGLAAMKKWRSDTPHGKADKSVTILGFGPSAMQQPDVHGEIWSLNNCYDVFTRPTMMRITRIFEMHKPEFRQFTPAQDGHTHYWHLHRLGRMGHRIVLQQKRDDVHNSETYPLGEAEALLQVPLPVLHGDDKWLMWDGTGPYMVAMAVLEGFTDIWLYGFDQMDWEHTLQREAFIAWLHFAKGRGIRVNGAMTFLKRHQRRYGYDYGPDWDEESNRLMWLGCPIEVKFKEESRSMKGEMYDGRK